ncbi:ROK family protein [Ginsengibacter hankyongi]|uniref:ROK family protein n=1 Tax=Ginsengibacter hankyongi TaxID=2607284 RepID=A0A5J5IEB6_9BACT|nr:ROK family protein [Ginsengibacter hankyongi]KAA9037623.1 ROK family protein [Ginsengibacter hankyongi]
MLTENNGKILSVDIGGSHIKATVLNVAGIFLQDYERLPTPTPATPGKVLDVIKELAQKFPGYDKVAAGFPGFIKDGLVKTAPNLNTADWANFNLVKALEEILGKPALVVNDADLQGLAVVSGKGLELMITLGTGFGTALLRDGVLMPHLEIAHHPVTKNKDYDAYIGEFEFKRIGKKKWNKRMKRVIEILKVVFNYDRLYISGGSAKEINFKLDDNIVIAGNRDGIKGGAKLWEQEHRMNAWKQEIVNPTEKI